MSETSSLFLSVPADPGTEDSDDACKMLSVHATLEELRCLNENEQQGLFTDVCKRFPTARVTTPYLMSPQVLLKETDEDKRLTPLDTPEVERPLCIVVEGGWSYDGPGPLMAIIERPNRAAGNMSSAITELLAWLQTSTHRAIMLPHEDGAVPRRIDRRLLCIGSDLFIQMKHNQQKRLLGFGYAEVHVVVDQFVLDFELDLKSERLTVSEAEVRRALAEGFADRT